MLFLFGSLIDIYKKLTLAGRLTDIYRKLTLAGKLELPLFDQLIDIYSRLTLTDWLIDLSNKLVDIYKSRLLWQAEYLQKTYFFWQADWESWLINDEENCM